jgi:DAK2 domain fusion protein YloV
LSNRLPTQELSCASLDPSKPLLACDGQGLKWLLNAGLAWLEQHRNVVNSLNVFPVPDGDTGTNMFLTLQAACEEIGSSPEARVGVVAQQASRGALMGARGNSGVIFSQILRGFAQSLKDKENCNTVEFAAALQRGSTVAYQAVIKPVEGTILTVIRESSEAAVDVAPQLADLRELFEYLVHAARDSVARTPQLLPVLREAGVVDAGGQGLFVILEGMTKCLYGEDMKINGELSQVMSLQQAAPEAGYGYDVQYILEGENLDVTQIRADISAMGDCPLVVGDGAAVKVHVHTASPGDPLNYGAQHGSLSRVVVENMQEQYQDFIMGHAAPVLPEQNTEDLSTAIVVVSPGSGLDKLFESLGANVIVSGGQTMNPSVERLLQAINDAPAPDVIVLPNNSNIILAAQQAQALSSKRVRVIPSKTVPQGVNALLAFSYNADLDDNARAMERGIGEVRTAEITTAVRGVSVNGLDVQEDQVIGLIDGDLKVAGEDMDTVIDRVLEQMCTDDTELITLYYGGEATAESTQALASRLSSHHPDIEVEVIEGDQPYYHYIISAE